MRSLRSSLASSSLAGRRTVRETEPVTAYTSVPRQKLNLVDVQVGCKLNTSTSPLTDNCSVCVQHWDWEGGEGERGEVLGEQQAEEEEAVAGETAREAA